MPSENGFSSEHLENLGIPQILEGGSGKLFKG